MKLRTISESVEKTDKKIKIKTLWLIADKVIWVLNEYGIGYDEALEDIVVEHLEMLPKLLQRNDNLRECKNEILKGLANHYMKHNCGVMDFVSEAIFAICTKKSDYKMLIDELNLKQQNIRIPYDENYVKDLIKALKESMEEL